MSGPHWHGYHHHGGRGFGRRLFWFVLGAGAATLWHKSHEAREWKRTHCWRDRIPQEAYPAPGQPALAPADGSSAGAERAECERRRGRWWREEWHRDAEGRWERGSGWGHFPQHPVPVPVPAPERAVPQAEAQPVQGWEEERRRVQELSRAATDTFTEMSEATLESLLTTVQSLKAKVAESRASHEEELRNQRFAQYKEYEEWKKQQAEQEKEKEQSPKRIV